MSKKSNTEIELEQLREQIRQMETVIGELNDRVSFLNEENITLKIHLEDYGFELDDVEPLPSAEVIAIEQLGYLQKISNHSTFDKNDADVYKTLVKSLGDIRRGTLNRDKKQKEMDEQTSDELLEKLNNVRKLKAK